MKIPLFYIRNWEWKNFLFSKQSLIIWLTLSSLVALNGQVIKQTNTDWQTNLIAKIKEKGYQSIALNLKENQLSVYYENRVQRFEPRALIEIIQLIGANNLPAEIDTILLVTQKLQLPILTTQFRLSDFRNWKQKLISLEAFVDKINIKQGGKRIRNGSTTNSGNYRLELEIKPEIGLGLGGFPDPVIHRLFILPTINAYLWKGALLQAEVILPISSEFEIPGEHFIRPGIISFSQTLQLPKQIWLQASVGYFSKNRYGSRLSLAKFWFNGTFAITGNVGYTGYASYPIKFGLEDAVKGWEYADIDYLDYNLGLNYWFKQWNTEIRLAYGKALFNKEQLKLTCLQRFNEVDIGFFALKTQRGNNYGMQLNIPIVPKRYWKPKRLSIRPANSLSYTYQATQATVETYTTGENILNLHRQLNPGFIKKQLLISDRWTLN